MTWLGLILRNLWRRPGRSIFTLAGVALAVASYLTLAGLSQGMDEGTQASLNERRIDLVVSRAGMFEVFGGSLPESLEARVRAVPGVADVSADLDTFMPAGEDTHAIVAGWRPEDFEYREMPLLRGRKPIPGQGEVALGDQLAQALHADVGSTVTLDFSQLRVAGIMGFTTGIMRGSAMMPLSDLQAMLSRPGQVTIYQLRLSNPGTPGAAAAVQARIKALQPGLSVDTTDEALRGNKIVAILAAASAAIALVALVMAGLSVLNTLAMAVEERTREIGILSMIGWSRGRVMRLVLGEGLILAGIGGLFGLALGYFGGRAVVLFVLPGSGLGVTQTVGLDAKAMAAALVVGALGAAWPAWRAAGLTPAMAMQHQ
jgi:putative ABC transport system permease protein